MNFGILKKIPLLIVILLFVSTCVHAEKFTRSFSPGWQIVAFPFSPGEDYKLCSLAERSDIVVFGAVGNRYVGCSELGTVAPGRAFWVYLPQTASFEFKGTPVDETKSFAVVLNPGWNLVGNPFLTEISLDTAARINGKPFLQADGIGKTAFYYDTATGKYISSLTLKPWTGYLIHSKRVAVLELSAKPGAAPSDDVIAADDSSVYAYPFTEKDPIARDESGNIYISNQLLVAFEAGTGLLRAEEVATSIGAQIIGRNERAGVYQFKLVTVSQKAAAGALKSFADVKGSSLNYLLSLNAVPNDPVFDVSAPALNRWGFEKVQLPAVWKEFFPQSNPIIAILDTGVDVSHKEFAGRVLKGKNLVDPAAADNTTDVNGHGTTVAGVALAEGDNGEGVAGVCWGCRILPVKVCTDTGVCPLYSVLNGITYAADAGARVINIAIGADFTLGSDVHELVSVVTEAAYSRNALIVGAAGNGAHDSATFLPGADQFVLSVGATDSEDRRADFSNYGTGVDVAAPGSQIYTTTAAGGYELKSGTSLSSAFAAGLAGLLLSIKPDLTAGELRDYIISNADPIATDYPLGGRINAKRAINALTGANRVPGIKDITAQKLFVKTGENIKIEVIAVDADGDPLVYEWSASAGTINSNGTNIIGWHAPDIRGVVDIRVTVKDTSGASDESEIQIVVLESDVREIRIEPASITMKRGETVQFAAYAYDAQVVGGVAAPVRINPDWKLTGGIGTIVQDGTFAAVNVGIGTVTAAADTYTASAVVTVESSEILPPLYTAATDAACGNDWLSLGCNLSRTSESTLNVQPYYTFRWCANTNTVYGGAAVVNSSGNVYVPSTDDKIYCLKQTDGSACGAGWPKNLADGDIEASIEVVLGATNSLYVGTLGSPSPQGKLYKINLTTGATTWQTAAADLNNRSIKTGVAVYGNMIYVTTTKDSDGTSQVFGIRDNGGTFTKMWTFPSAVGTIRTTGYYYNTPAVEDVDGGGGAVATVYVGSEDYLYAICAGTGTDAVPGDNTDCSDGAGTQRWTYYSEDNHIHGAVVKNGYVYAVLRTGKVLKLNAATGAQVWEYNIGVGTYGQLSYYDNPAGNDVLFVGSNDGYVRAMEDLGGSANLKWQSAEMFGAPGYMNWTKCVVSRAGSVVICSMVNGFASKLKLLNISNGTTAQSFPAPDDYWNSPAVALGPSGDAEIYLSRSNQFCALERNYAPTITPGSVTITPATRPPHNLPTYDGRFKITAVVNDQNNKPAACSDSDIYKITVDLSPVGGATSSVNLYDNGTFGDSAANDCTYTNDGAISGNVLVQLGTSPGVKNICVTVTDYGGETDTECGTLTVTDVPPTLSGCAFTPNSIPADGLTTTTLECSVTDGNNNISSVTVNLSPIGGGASDPLTFISGDTWRRTGITASVGTTPQVYNPVITATDASNTATSSATLTVTSAAYCSTWTVTTNNDCSNCYGSLRECIKEANATGGSNTITFDNTFDWDNNPIVLGSALQTLSGINSNGTIIKNDTGKVVTIDGNNGNFNCIRIESANNEIRGLTIVRFSAIYGSIEISGISATGNIIAGNYIGTNSSDSVGLGNTTGIYIGSGAKNNTIGGIIASERNIISGNTQVGIHMQGEGIDGNKVYGNYIGTNVSGTAALANSDGIRIENGSKNNIIGGTTISERNIISGNTSYGVYIVGFFKETSGNKIFGNYIGTNAAGNAAVANGSYGVFILGDAVNGYAKSNEIGGSAGKANIIANNGDDGIYITGASTRYNTISQNRIYSNTGLGIDLAGDGANDNLAAPVISCVDDLGGGSYEVNGTACASCTVEVFRVDNVAAPVVGQDGSGAGEGYAYLDKTTTDGSGNFTITVTVSGGTYVTATVTDANGNTSEFAQNKDVTSSPCDTNPPIQSNWNPAKGSTIATTSPTITFNTDENA
ncbi:MAG: S8 family serine peptidase, partial [bacterium]